VEKVFLSLNSECCYSVLVPVHSVLVPVHNVIVPVHSVIVPCYSLIRYFRWNNDAYCNMVI